MAPHDHNKKRMQQKPLDIGVFMHNPSKKRINKHLKLTTKVGISAGTRANKVPSWLVQKRDNRKKSQVKVQAWVEWLKASGWSNITEGEVGNLLDIYGDAPPRETRDGYRLPDNGGGILLGE